MGNTPSDVYNASLNLSEKMPQLKNRIEAMRGKMLTENQVSDYARNAYSLKWDLTPVKRIEEDENGNDVEKESTVFHPNYLTAIRRDEDKASNLWNTFNVVQENILKGMNIRIPTNHGKRTLRPVKGINENLRLNTALWNLAESYL
jgi:hypothetical protein